MMLKKISIVIVLTLLASSCGAPAATRASPSLEDVQSTSMAGAFTALAETHIALPTGTQIPPTKPPTQTLAPSKTPEASPTVDVTFTPSFTSTALENDPCNQPLTSWKSPSTKLILRYEYSPQSRNDQVVLSLWVRSVMGECGFLTSLSSGPVGQYSALAFVDGEKKDFKVSGGFRLTEGSWEIIIRNDVIVAKGGCYPNC
jgi:hypothetical protein